MANTKQKHDTINEQYYYIREGVDQEKHGDLPIATICLLKYPGENRWARGVAICSPEDNPCKKKGREIAKHRAEDVRTRNSFIRFGRYLNHHTGTSWPSIFDYSEEFTSKLFGVLQSSVDHPYDGFLAVSNARLTVFEKELLGLIEKDSIPTDLAGIHKTADFSCSSDSL